MEIKTCLLCCQPISNLDLITYFFSSVVLTDKEIRQSIIADIDYEEYDIIPFTLTCGKETLKSRHQRRGDKNEVNYYWLELPNPPGDMVIDTDNKSIEQICDEMYDIIIS